MFKVPGIFGPIVFKLPAFLKLTKGTDPAPSLSCTDLQQAATWFLRPLSLSSFLSLSLALSLSLSLSLSISLSRPLHLPPILSCNSKNTVRPLALSSCLSPSGSPSFRISLSPSLPFPLSPSLPLVPAPPLTSSLEPNPARDKKGSLPSTVNNHSFQSLKLTTRVMTSGGKGFVASPKPQTPHPTPQTPNSKPQAPNPKPQTPDLKH